jgi:hypothetical protein
LNAQAAHYEKKSLGVFSPVHGVPPIDVKGKTVLGTLCRSAVYATAAAAAAMCCVDTVGAGCILCVSAAAAAGSALADQCRIEPARGAVLRRVHEDQAPVEDKPTN